MSVIVFDRDMMIHITNGFSKVRSGVVGWATSAWRPNTPSCCQRRRYLNTYKSWLLRGKHELPCATLNTVRMCEKLDIMPPTVLPIQWAMVVDADRRYRHVPPFPF